MQTSAIEYCGASLAIAYLLLVTQRRWWAWPAYIASSLLYIPVFWENSLYLEALLQLFFVIMGAYSWQVWRKLGEVVEPIEWPSRHHWRILTGWGVLTLLCGTMMALTPAGPFAYADAFVTIGSVIATYVTFKRVVENWCYWIAINLVAVTTYSIKGMWVTVALYSLYLLLSVRGLMAWRAALRKAE